jgi:uncharacterized protein DUF3275
MPRSQPAPRPTHGARFDAGPVVLPGTLLVKWISGRNGDFAVGDLHTALGEFRVKDALLDQFEAGEYRGRFWVSQIYAKSYEYRGRITIETRATIADLQIDAESDEVEDDSPHAIEPDPVDETPPAPPPKSVPRKQREDAAGTTGSDDKTLFGPELYELVRTGQSVKLDPTVDRLLFRQQKERLKALRFVFDVKTQSWHSRN